MRRWFRSLTRRPDLSVVWASNLATQPPSRGTLHAMIKGAMAAQDEQTARYATSTLN